MQEECKNQTVVSEELKANSIIKEDFHTDFNEFINNDVTLRDKDLKNLKVLWIPEKIIFANGSTLE